MTKATIVIGGKYFSYYIGQSNYWPILQSELLIAPLKKTLKNNCVKRLLQVHENTGNISLVKI